LDVENLTHVINYGLPDDVENYTHRSGRTGRADKTGTSIAIVNLREKGKIRLIEKTIGKQFAVGVLPTGKQICEKQLLKVIDDLEKVKVNEDEIAPYMTEVYRKLDWLTKEDVIKRVVSHEFNRFSDYYRDHDEIDVPSERGGERTGRGMSSRSGRSRGDRSTKAEPGFTRFFINMGKMDNFYAKELIQLVNSKIRGKRIDIGRIDLMKNFSFFEVDEKQAPLIPKALNKAQFNGRQIAVEETRDGNVSPEKTSRRGGDFHDSHRKKEYGSGKKEYGSKKEERSSKKKEYKKDDWHQFFQSPSDEGGKKRKKK
jgi:ATP-dependent RNA helicase DeaD